MCIMKREICRTRGNFTYYHPGGCQGFPLDKGRHFLRQQDFPWSDTHCEIVSLKPYTFYPDKPLHIQLTVNYVNALPTSKVHEATVTWTENVNMDNFTACISRTGRNDNPSYELESVDWIAYQGAPNGGVTGRERFTRWWTGTTCRTISFPGGKFSSSPTVLATLQHERRGLKHDAASVWIEDISSSSIKVCLRELQNFDGVHEDINVYWMAFEILHRPLFTEHGSIDFPNDYTPQQSDNYAFCKTVEMVRNYTKQPLVMVTPTHRTGGGRKNPQCNGISAWIESITSQNFHGSKVLSMLNAP
ncbi:uncharacterized protein LOC116293136 [Actinia tenebrosa]|uniref:Uncharacterized protein LOC116293136 n=1 Tax=Actinia tenebrosa TaxID=6105 RepID=A0A6P8HKT1_ACTTE|nr:uncharacterized protein LOC116293136 [Actinia tenebrosa]